MPTQQDILNKFKAILYPGYSRDIVSFGLVKNVEVSDNAVTVKLALVNEKRNVGEKLRSPVEAALRELDFLLIDLPPGTGDAQLALSQKLALTGTIIVSTPQPIALSDAMKGLRMFQQA